MHKIFKSHLIPKRALATCENIVKSPAPDLNLSRNTLLPEYFLGEISKWSDRLALECVETKRSYTYLDLRRKSLALAHFLKNSLKLQEKSGVGICLPNVPEYPIVVLASLQAGLQISPLNPNYTQVEIKKHLINSNAKVLFATAESENEVRSVCDNLNIPVIAIKTKRSTSLSRGTINFFEYVSSNRQNLDEIYIKNMAPDDIVLLPFSSGTTGLPKGVQLSHDNMVSNLTQGASPHFNCFKTDRDETILALLPFFHIYGLSYVLLHALSQGAKLITYPKFTSQNFVNGLRQYRPTYIPLAPPVVHLMNTSPDIKPLEDLASLKLILCGAAPLKDTDVFRFKELTRDKVGLFQAYGMSETSPLASIQTDALEGGVKIGGCGYLVPNTEAKFVSIENTENIDGLGAKEDGELWLRGPQIMKGYLDNPRATRDTITDDGWLKTGDIGHYDDDGHIFITDRLKELIKVQGFPVAPAELEGVIRNHPAVEDVAVIGVQHERLGEAPKAFVVQKKNVRLNAEDIQEFVAANVVKYKHLAGGVTFLEHIPKTASGKILRRELKKVNPTSDDHKFIKTRH